MFVCLFHPKTKGFVFSEAFASAKRQVSALWKSREGSQLCPVPAVEEGDEQGLAAGITELSTRVEKTSYSLVFVFDLKGKGSQPDPGLNSNPVLYICGTLSMSPKVTKPRFPCMEKGYIREIASQDCWKTK